MLARVLLLICLLSPFPALAQLRWEAGRNYITLAGTAPSGAVSGRIEVAEVFSYGCIHCYRAKDAMAALAASLPPDAAMTYVHAAFQPAEGWPTFQRAWYTAQALGIGEAVHDRMFAAVWETGEIPLLDPATGSLRRPLPTIEEIAALYARVSTVKAAEFLRIARSPEIDAQMLRADELIKAWRIPGTPAVVVNGRYLIDNSTLGGWDEMNQLVAYLVGLERQRLRRPAPARP
jgi:protein dithiol oxidoreductase (disulfide-forming)